ncbi:MAG: pantetheine-phosphate adenylyltransferase [Rhodovibrionaceae bacterium]|nr:pantetheine-phosphate adenylyltransferase [Rhodovibrionaceae bacterium]
MSDRGPLVALYPGTFDPITKGHTDIITRATKIVDRLIVAVAVNAGKNPLFSLEERTEMVREDIEAIETNGVTVDVRPFDNLLMHFAQEMGARIILRGLRAVSDFEYEFQMAGMNARLSPDVETVFLMASERQQFISSRFVKEIGQMGGDIRSFVSPRVAAHMEARIADGSAKPVDTSA